MLDRTFLHSSKRKAVLIFLLIGMAAVIVVGARTRRVPAKKSPAPAVAPVPLSVEAGQNQRGRDHDMQVERVIVARHGFDRLVITRSKGPFLLAIDNRSGLEVIDLQIVRENGNHHRQMKVHRKNPNWRGLVDLPPGNYKLMETSHPDWVCRITITSR